jgi:hypothetical protein
MLTIEFWENLILLLTAIIAIILLVSLEMISSYHGKINILIDKKRLRISSTIAAMAFIITAAIRIAGIVTA